jgi:transcription elongation factor GreA
VRNLSNGMEDKYQFVGAGEEDYSGEVMKILTSSPLAKAMLGKKPGDQVDVPLPKGLQKMEIVAVQEPNA